MAGLKSADGILAGFKSADEILDRAELTDSVQAGVESADLAYTVSEYAPEPEPPPEPPPYSQRTQSRPDRPPLCRVRFLMGICAVTC